MVRAGTGFLDWWFRWFRWVLVYWWFGLGACPREVVNHLPFKAYRLSPTAGHEGCRPADFDLDCFFRLGYFVVG